MKNNAEAILNPPIRQLWRFQLRQIGVSLWCYLAAYRYFFSYLPAFLIFTVIVCTQFYTGWVYNSNDTTNTALQIARATSWAMLPLLTLLWLPILRNGLAISHAFIGRWLPLSSLKNIHKTLGWMLLVLAVVHSSHYLFYYNSLQTPLTEAILGTQADLVRAMQTSMYEFVSEDEDIDMVAEWIHQGAPQDVFQQRIRPVLKADCTKCHSETSTMTYAKPSMPLSEYNEVLSWTPSGIASKQFRVNVSGLLMFAALLVLGISALPWVRQRVYHWFQTLHYLGFMIAGLALLHIPDVQWLVAPVAILFIDRVSEWLWRYYPQRPARLSRISKTVVKLDIAMPDKMNFIAGYYVRIRIPQIHPREWHSFSPTGFQVEQGHLILLIQCQGDWTQQLLALCDNNAETLLTADVQGGFPSPSTQAQHSQDWLLIAGGVGITPFLSLLQAVQNGKQTPRSITVLWVVRDAGLVRWLQPWITAWAARYDMQWLLHITGKENILEFNDIAQTTNVHLHYGRPDWTRILDNLAIHSTAPTCFACGSVALVKQASRSCQQQGWLMWAESF
ncbi:NADPH oxidase family protein [Candidatus Albibeggiatoa sp. nov. BB20]|uniref:ferric reductase family protein n=1 Tax=Candidatus Albibeggiatoa sp. nov. BB20 TaxID=3162723 RepID=UPI0033659743